MHLPLIYSLKVTLIKIQKLRRCFSSPLQVWVVLQVCFLAEMASAWMYSYLLSLIFPHIVS